ncbi:hypothetical protein [Bradyrhizobium ivorense]|uniref:hypothetical protein n=1 Tax=Bradyrhizobium ivorense TaxID=2511166 RepID=UPI001E43A009|nr:hypothetical protein [Bradyrhizobium ivorense]
MPPSTTVAAKAAAPAAAPPASRAHSPERSEYDALSMLDLLDAREQYHVHLMRHPKVLATAIGYYRIRKEDTPPGVTPIVRGEGVRTLTNSEVRSYSWPAVLVFVDDWIAATEFGSGRRYNADEAVPKTLYLPDGRRVPVCVIEAPKDPVSPEAPAVKRHPLNNIGSGHPVFVDVQNRNHFATVACLVTDGHKAYALTNRHVTGETGEVLSSQLGGRAQPIGTSSSHHATRVPFTDVYPSWPGKSVYVNMDAGLIDIKDANAWTAKLQDGSVMGPMVDLSSAKFPDGAARPHRPRLRRRVEPVDQRRNPGAVLSLQVKGRIRIHFRLLHRAANADQGDTDAAAVRHRPRRLRHALAAGAERGRQPRRQSRFERQAAAAGAAVGRQPTVFGAEPAAACLCAGNLPQHDLRPARCRCRQRLESGPTGHLGRGRAFCHRKPCQRRAVRGRAEAQGIDGQQRRHHQP